MSYPSIHAQLAIQGVTPKTATKDQMRKAFLAAFREDLPLGLAVVMRLINKLRDSGRKRVILSCDPNSPEGRQYARILGPDIPRQVLEHYHEVKLGFYNCCSGVAANNSDDLRMTMREQIEVQNPNFVDC